MKNVILAIILLGSIFTSYSQGETRKFDLNTIISLSNMSKENAHVFLTEDDFFGFVSSNDEGFLYGLNYNEITETATIWIRKSLNKGELLVFGKNKNVDVLLKELKTKKIKSNLKDDGELITIYEHNSKEIVVYIDNRQAVTMEIKPLSKTETISNKLRRYDKILAGK
ncbi:MAG: hypothetical protein V7734_07025 [Maribacter arcticus]|uniref:hypothetical protein n=1 Tax=Maribacter arcticus TaxID=561365 RepID=UPI003002BD9B